MDKLLSQALRICCIRADWGRSCIRGIASGDAMKCYSLVSLPQTLQLIKLTLNTCQNTLLIKVCCSCISFKHPASAEVQHKRIVSFSFAHLVRQEHFPYMLEFSLITQ